MAVTTETLSIVSRVIGTLLFPLQETGYVGDSITSIPTVLAYAQFTHIQI